MLILKIKSRPIKWAYLRFCNYSSRLVDTTVCLIIKKISKFMSLMIKMAILKIYYLIFYLFFPFFSIKNGFWAKEVMNRLCNKTDRHTELDLDTLVRWCKVLQTTYKSTQCSTNSLFIHIFIQAAVLHQYIKRRVIIRKQINIGK